jgi:phosphoglucosamine mutase
LAYLTREGDDFVAGVMVTASHNPYEYNGVKVFDKNGGKLTDETEVELNRLIESEITPRGSGEATSDSRLINSYEDFLVESAEGLGLSGLRLAVDSANGAASGLAERVFERLGAQVTALFDEPDGQNINTGCGATDTEALSREVTGQKLDLGIALDGDADRLVMVDGQGREVNGDYLMYLLAVSRQLKGVVATVMSNFGLEAALQKRDITLERVQVGDRYVLEGLQRTGFRLGGEQSGHLIFPELLPTGDGLLAAVQTLKALSDSGKSLAQWRDEVELLPQALVNIKLSDQSLLDQADVQAFIKGQTDRLAGKGRLLIRPSGTEPLARVMVEAPEATATAKRIATELEVLLKKAAIGGRK